jgi:hypothetical protein
MSGPTYSHRPPRACWTDTETRGRIRDHEALNDARESDWSAKDTLKTGLVRREPLEEKDPFSHLGIFHG